MGWLNWLWVCVSSERSWITAACCDTCWNTALTGTFSTPGREEVRCQLLPPHCLHGTTRVILCPGLCQADLCQVWCCFWWSDCSSDQPGKLRSLSSAEGKGDIDRWEAKSTFGRLKIRVSCMQNLCSQEMHLGLWSGTATEQNRRLTRAVSVSAMDQLPAYLTLSLPRPLFPAIILSCICRP